MNLTTDEILEKCAKAGYEACMEAYAPENYIRTLPGVDDAFVRSLKWEQADESCRHDWRVAANEILVTYFSEIS